MLAELGAAEIDAVLRRQCIGRLGICGDDTVYIFPVAYGYDGACVYFVSHEGLKVRLMRSHPHVAFQVDEIPSPAEWRSVLLHGTYEELAGEAARDAAMAAIIEQAGDTAPPSFAPYIDGPEKIVVYRLHITERTGRYEHSHGPALGR